MLAFSACNKDDDKPAPAQARVLAVQAAPSANVQVKVLVDTKNVGQLSYGQNIQNGNYTSVDAGSRMIYVNDASSNNTIASLKTTFDQNKSYSIFAYSPTTALGSADILVTPDDLMVPTAGKAKIRIVNLGVSLTNPVSLSVLLPQGGTSDIVPMVAFAKASAFTEITPGPYNFAVSTGTGTSAVVEAMVGDGNGNTAVSRTYEAGKIYTVVLRGVKSSAVATDLRLKASVIQNN
ncbi:DUF4397 domain-containing protein [Hymenobacter amundsenii]|nr:DUF4397 domain-containing protein [Hymenobacter amundsenii]